jgi:hypothetical protein
MRLTHFQAMTVFALLLAMTFASLGRRSTRARIRYAVLAFLCFMLVAVAIGWLLFPRD